MNNHIPVVHDNCRNIHCNICEGGLFSCSICGGTEVTLPTECPGGRMTADEQDGVGAGQMDFKKGHWWLTKKGKNTNGR